jgi:hypothetical protein
LSFFNAAAGAVGGKRGADADSNFVHINLNLADGFELQRSKETKANRLATGSVLDHFHLGDEIAKKHNLQCMLCFFYSS